MFSYEANTTIKDRETDFFCKICCKINTKTKKTDIQFSIQLIYYA